MMVDDRPWPLERFRAGEVAGAAVADVDGGVTVAVMMTSCS
jgi:hypothetical protein